MNRVLVTGASGFIGAHALPELAARGFEIHALGRTPPTAVHTVFHKIDLLNQGNLKRLLESLRASHLLHLAWYAEPTLYWQSPLNLDWTAASLTLVRHFREAGGERAVIAGTCAEYTWGPARLTEDAPCRAATLYGAAKDATHRLLVAYARQTGLSLACGRLFFLYGPGERNGRLVSDAIRSLKAGRRFATTPGHQRRDFSYVADAAAAFAALVDAEIDGSYNIGSGRAIPVRDILERIGAITGRADLIDYGARPLPPGEPSSIEADVTNLYEKIGFAPQYDLALGLSETVKAYNTIIDHCCPSESHVARLSGPR